MFFFAERYPGGRLFFHPIDHISYSTKVSPANSEEWRSISSLVIGGMYKKGNVFVLMRVSRKEYEDTFGEPAMTMNPDQSRVWISRAQRR